MVSYFKLHLKRILFGGALVLLFLMNVAGVIDIKLISQIENLSYDARLRLMMPNTLDKHIVIVDIDEKSLHEQGRWPWSRNKVASMVDMLFDRYHVNTLGFDMVFSEEDNSSGFNEMEALASGELANNKQYIESLSKNKSRLDYDGLFAASLKNRNIVMGFYLSHNEPHLKIANQGLLPPSIDSLNGNPLMENAFEESGYTSNLKRLQGVSAGGYFNASAVDDDGVFRRQPMVEVFNGKVYPALSLAVINAYLGNPGINLGYSLNSEKRAVDLNYLIIGDKKVSVDEDFSTLIPYRGKQGSFSYVSATDVINGRADSKILNNAIILVGTSAIGLNDLRPTPVQGMYPGVEVHANLISSILNDEIKHRPFSNVGFEFLTVLFLGVLLAALLPSVTPFYLTLISVLTLTAFLSVNFYLWHYKNYALQLATVSITIISIFLMNMITALFVEVTSRKRITAMFGQYVPHEIVKSITSVNLNLSNEGESRDMTVLFSDVRGFTSISEGLEPKQLTQLMNDFFTPMTHVIHHYRGTIDKYMGDAVMAFWGAPLPDPTHAKHSVDAALFMVKRLAAMQKTFQKYGIEELSIGIGISTGLMTVGNMGSEFRMAYTVMGDAVNLGSRLESLTKIYGVSIIVSENTARAANMYQYRLLDTVRVKGKNKPTMIYEPLCRKGEETQGMVDELELYHEMVSHYQNRQWKRSLHALDELMALYPSKKVYKMYAERNKTFITNPPPAGWDGVFIHDEK